MARFEMPADRLWYVPTPARVDTVEGMFDGSLFRYPETADVVILCCYSDHYYDLPTIPGSIKEINIAAMSMSVMNMWLAATALGVGAGWDSFPVIGEGVLRTSPSRVPRLVLCGGRFFEGFGGEQPAAQSVHHVVRGFAPPVLRGVGHGDVASLLLCDGFGFLLLGFEEALGELFKQVEEP